MSKTDILNEVPRLNPEERLEILDRIYELDGGNWEAGAELSPSDKALLDARLQEIERNPDAGSPWEEVKARLDKRFAE